MAENRRLAAARVLKGLTQRQLAEVVGTREIEISRIETGRVTPDAAIKQRIALVLGGIAEFVTSAVFSPDGTKIAFTSDRSALDDIWVMNADGSEYPESGWTGMFW